MSRTMLTSIMESVLGQLSVLVIFAVGALLLGLAASGIATRRGWRRFPAVLAGVSLALALAVTQGRRPFEFGALEFSRCSLFSSTAGISETLLNVGMLMPLGFFAAYATRRALGPILLCLATSVLTETAQAAFATGVCVGQDVAANVLGGAVAACVGFALVRHSGNSGHRKAGRDHDR